MYYHPSLIDIPHRNRVLSGCRALTEIWVDAMSRQHELLKDAVRAHYDAQTESIRMLSTFDNSAQVAAHVLSSAASDQS